MNALSTFLSNIKDLNIIFLTKFGSHLYGTNTELSDEDYKGVYLPTLEQCYLNEIPKSISFNSNKGTGKNTDEDIDIELYSLHYYLKLLQKGDTGALDMLHAPLDNEDIVLKQTSIWKELHANRKDFYTTNLSAFVGYCRTQASKYGIKGSRLNDAKRVLDFLNSRMDHSRRLADVWDLLPTGEYIHVLPAEGYCDYGFYQVCGKKIQETVTIAYAIDIVKRFYEAYGARAKLAAENKGIDWKAVSHALRCAYEMLEVYTKGSITFPLEQAKLILEVKEGKHDYTTIVAPILESLMAEVEILCKESNYPAKININKYNQWLIKTVSSNVKE